MVVSGDERDWPAVRAAVGARMKELGLSPAEAARRMRLSPRTLAAFLQGRTTPQDCTVDAMTEGLGLPPDHLEAMAERRKPFPLLLAAAAGGTPVAALLSLTDLGPGAQLAADYRAYVALVAKELAEGMTGEQRMNTGRFLHDLATAVSCY